MRYYQFDEKSLSYKPTKLTSKKLIFTGILSMISIISLFVTIAFQEVKVVKYKNKFDYINKESFSKHDLYPGGEELWKDSVFSDYAKRAQIYLDRPTFKGTPLKGEMMALAARNAYDSTGVLLPVELALSQCQWESGMGREGRSPKNNPFNIGEQDNGTTKWFNSTFEGTQAYYYWMCRNYLSCRTVDDLFANFVNCNGKRYASQPSYEQTIRNSYYNIKNWINKNIENK
jgi:hypothetical protein